MTTQRWVPVAALTAVLTLSALTARAEKDRFDVGEPVPTFSLKVVNPEVVGSPYLAIDKFYAGADQPKKAVLVSFFATYCEPCKKEMPYLAAMYDAYKDKGLQILSVSIDRDAEQIEFVKTLAQQSHVKFPVLSDRFNIVAKRYFIEKLPLVYLVNGEGKVALVKVGYNDDITRVLLEEVRKLVGEPASAPVPEGLKRFLNGHGAPTADASAVAAGTTAAPTATDAAPAEAEVDDPKKKGKKAKAAKTKKKK